VQGQDTAFDSARLNSVFAFPLSGRAPFVLTWDEFGQYFDKMTRTGVVKSMKDFYWDIRPKPEYGTIEVRVFDTPLTIERAAALAGYVQSLAAWFLAEQPFMPQEDDYLVYTYNRFQACRFGLDAVYVDPATGQHMPLREHLLHLDRIAGHAATHGATARCTCCAARRRPARTTPAGCASASARSSCWPRSAARQRCAFGAAAEPHNPAHNAHPWVNST
jgi:carboxylate-amine ligase